MVSNVISHSRSEQIFAKSELSTPPENAIPNFFLEIVLFIAFCISCSNSVFISKVAIWDTKWLLSAKSSRFFVVSHMKLVIFSSQAYKDSTVLYGISDICVASGTFKRKDHFITRKS